jgi:hypothetical protein
VQTPIEPGKHAELNGRDEIRAWFAKLHARLIEGCPAAREQLAAFLLHLLRRQLTARFASVDRELIHDAVVDEIMRYLETPGAFDAANGLSLAALLGSGARRRLCNSIRCATRRQKREAAWQEQRLQKNIFELRASAQQYTLEQFEGAALRAVSGEPERKCMALLMACERRTDAYAEALGIADKAASIRRLAVKRVKDRLKARLKQMAKQQMEKA